MKLKNIDMRRKNKETECNFRIKMQPNYTCTRTKSQPLVLFVLKHNQMYIVQELPKLQPKFFMLRIQTFSTLHRITAKSNQ